MSLEATSVGDEAELHVHETLEQRISLRSSEYPLGVGTVRRSPALGSPELLFFNALGFLVLCNVLPRAGSSNLHASLDNAKVVEGACAEGGSAEGAVDCVGKVLVLVNPFGNVDVVVVLCAGMVQGEGDG